MYMGEGGPRYPSQRHPNKFRGFGRPETPSGGKEMKNEKEIKT